MASSMASSKGRVSRKGSVWRFNVRVGSKRVRQSGFKTRAEAIKAMTQAKAGKKVSRNYGGGAERFWTSEKFIYIRNHILPKSRTLDEALRKVETKYGKRPNRSYFSNEFKRQFGHSPKQYLGIETGPIENPFPDLPPNLNPVILLQRTKELEKEIEHLSNQIVDSKQKGDAIKELIWGFKDVRFEIPNWTTQPDQKQTVHGIPSIAMGDWHLGEQIDGKNVISGKSYNLAEADRRLERIATKTCEFVSSRVLSKSNYPGIIMPMLGDFFPGYIHDDGRGNMELPMFPLLVWAEERVTAIVKLFKSEFGRVFMPCVPGNHTRLDKKPRSKNAVYDNFEWMFYHNLAKRYQKDPDVHVVVPDAFEVRYQVYGTRYLITHGFEFRGGTGITGPLLPWTRGFQKKQQQSCSASNWTGRDLNFDVMILGHWHQYFPSRNFIVNGALVEHNEFATQAQFPYEPACQALWLTHPKLGITIQAPVYAEPLDRYKGPTGSWVSVFDESV